MVNNTINCYILMSSLKQQSVGRHVAPLGHIILIPSQPVFARSNMSTHRLLFQWAHQNVTIDSIVDHHCLNFLLLIVLDNNNSHTRFMVFNVTLNNISDLYHGSQFYLWRKPEYQEKTTDMWQVTDKLYHIITYISPWTRFERTRLVVIGIDCTDNWESNYHTITTTTASCRILDCKPFLKNVKNILNLRFKEKSYTPI
jgi:hypothetical protein